MRQADLTGICVLMVMSVITAFVYNHVSPTGISLIGQWDSKKGTVRAVSKADTISTSDEIRDPAVIAGFIKHQNHVLLDVREKTEYAKGRLPGALSYPLETFDDDVHQILMKIKRNTPLVIYCSGPECGKSHEYASLLKQLKYTDIKIFSGGYQVWKESGRKIEKNEE